MNREELKELGLSDEQIEKVMISHGKVVNSTKEKADKVDGLESQIEDYKQQIADRDTQLDDLQKKAKGNDDLQEEINRLKQENEDTKNQYEKDLQDKTFNYELEKAISAQQAKNIKSVKANLDLEKIKLDGDKLLGLDEQLTALKESDSYLFGEDVKPNSPTIVAPGNPNGGTFTHNPFSKESWNLTEQGKIYKENPDLYKQLKSQAGK